MYSDAQAAQGDELYAGFCVSCHAGMGNHTGPVFRTRWAGQTVLDMYHYMSENMPKNAPGSLSPEEYMAVIAYLFKLNGMPAGKVALPVDTLKLQAITIDTTATTP